MIVFDLRCGGGHVFEAWFGSSEDFGAQRERGLVECPLCGDRAVDKAVMAPNIAAKSNTRAAPPSPAMLKAQMAALARAQVKALEGSQWVGGEFATKARAMHDGDIPHKTIHGQASMADAKALVDDGVPVAPLPFPVAPPDQVN